MTRAVLKDMLLIALFLLFDPPLAGAEENGRIVTGAHLYRLHRASCHGESGHGDGMVGAALRTPPGDLTALARKNDGGFPAQMVVEFIDGTRDVRAHGPREMPVWGLILSSQETVQKIIDHLRALQQP